MAWLKKGKAKPLEGSGAFFFIEVMPPRNSVSFYFIFVLMMTIAFFPHASKFSSFSEIGRYLAFSKVNTVLIWS